MLQKLRACFHRAVTLLLSDDADVSQFHSSNQQEEIKHLLPANHKAGYYLSSHSLFFKIWIFKGPDNISPDRHAEVTRASNICRLTTLSL